ncbi:MAG: type VI secretion system protein ImpJ [Myxococcota bacterium]|jgi:type VI secretion system protein ImpJ
MSSRKLLPVAWTEGMFLRPQHLQQQDAFNADRVAARIAAIDPYQWGVREFEVDTEALADNRIEITRLEVIMPGGAIVHFPGNATVESREFSPELEELDVYIAIPRIKPAEANSSSMEGGGRDVRYWVKSETAPDINRGGFDTPIDLLMSNIRVFVTGEELELETTDSIKIAKVVATGDVGRPFALARDYCAPLLILQGCPPLVEEINKVVSQIAAKVRIVSGRTTTVSTADLPNMWMRYTLARMTPVLRHLLGTGSTNPFELYTALVETAGALSSFALQEPADLPAYKHNDLFRCYSELLAFIDTHLGGAVPDRFSELKLELQTASGRKVYATKALTAEQVDPRNHFFLGIKAQIETDELISMVAETGKAASIDELGSILMMNLNGLKIDHLPGAPTEIASKTGYEYFKIESHGPAWARVKNEFSFAVSIGNLESADVSLYVVAHGE